MDFLLENKEVFLLLLLSVSEVLALVPNVKANSIFQLVYNQLKKVKK